MSDEYQLVGKGLRFVFFGEIIGAVALFLRQFPTLGPILTAAGQVLVLVGLYTAGKANPGLRTAFLVGCINLLVAVITIFLPFATALNTILKAIEVYFVCSATSGLLSSKGDERYARRGRFIWRFYVGCVIAAIACMALARVPVVGVIAAVVIAAAAVVMVVTYVLYMLFLFQAQDILLQ